MQPVEGPIRAEMAAAGLDAALLTSPAAVFRLGGAWISSQRLIPERIAAVLITPETRPVLLVNHLEEEAVRRQTRLTDLRTYHQFAPGPGPAVAALIGSVVPNARRVGVEERSLTKGLADAIAASLPGITWAPVDNAVDAVLAAKEDWEIERLEQNARLLAGAIASAAARSKAGDSERQVGARMLEYLVAEGGADYSQMGASAASGPNARVTHHGGADRHLQTGDLVRLTCRGVFRGYHGIVARSAVVGRQSAHAVRIFSDLAALHDGLMARMRPAAMAADVFRETVDDYAAHGHILGLPHVGHSVGLSLQERPQFHPYATGRVAGDMMCVAITVIDDERDGKFYLEDVVRITDQGAIRASSGPPALIEIPDSP